MAAPAQDAKVAPYSREMNPPLSTNLISVFGVYTKLETLLQYCRSIDDLRYPDHYCAVLFKIVEPVALLSCCQ